MYFNSDNIINFRFMGNAVFYLSKIIVGVKQFPQKFHSSCRMFALMHAHTYREIPSFLIGRE